MKDFYRSSPQKLITISPRVQARFASPEVIKPTNTNRLVNDLTFRKPVVIRPGSLQPIRAARPTRLPGEVAGQYLDPAALRRQPTVIRPRPRAVVVQTAHPHTAVKASLATAASHTVAAYARAIMHKDWRSLVPEKHKQYTAAKGVRLQPKSFRFQSGALILVAVLALATAQTAAPRKQTATTKPATPASTSAPAAERSAKLASATEPATNPAASDSTGSSIGSRRAAGLSGQTGHTSRPVTQYGDTAVRPTTPVTAPSQPVTASTPVVVPPVTTIIPPVIAPPSNPDPGAGSGSDTGVSGGDNGGASAPPSTPTDGAGTGVGGTVQDLGNAVNNVAGSLL